MDIKKVKEERHELLARMRDALMEELIACGLREPENENEPEILTVVLDGLGETGDREGGIGEFFFAPSNENDTVMHFCAVLTLIDELEKDYLPQLFEAMSYINFRMPCGCYCTDREGSLLCYRMTVPLSVNLSGEELFEQMNVTMSNAFIAADLYSDMLIKLAAGEKTPESVMDNLI